MQHMALILLQRQKLQLASRADQIIFRTSLNQKQQSNINLFAGLNIVKQHQCHEPAQHSEPWSRKWKTPHYCQVWGSESSFSCCVVTFSQKGTEQGCQAEFLTHGLAVSIPQLVPNLVQLKFRPNLKSVSSHLIPTLQVKNWGHGFLSWQNSITLLLPRHSPLSNPGLPTTSITMVCRADYPRVIHWLHHVPQEHHEGTPRYPKAPRNSLMKEPQHKTKQGQHKSNSEQRVQPFMWIPGTHDHSHNFPDLLFPL